MQPEIIPNNQLFQMIVEASPSGLLIVDSNGRVILVNLQASEWFGYEKHELLGQSVETLLPMGQRDAHARHRARFAERCDGRTLAAGRDLLARRKDGSAFSVDISLHPIDYPSGQLVLANIQDASQRRRAEQVPKERLAAIGEMVAGLAHESRNALQRARGCLDLLELDLAGQQEQLDLTERIRRALGDLERNYEEVRGYAAPINLEISESDLSQLIQQAFDDLQMKNGRYPCRLLVEATKLHSVNRVDAVRMKQVFRNLLENSIAASPPGSEIVAKIELVELGELRLQRTTISDSGTGIPASISAHVFDPFFTTKQSGTGLGLAICRRIVETHGGNIALLSPEPKSTGRGTAGTTIEITLPLAGRRRHLDCD